MQSVCVENSASLSLKAVDRRTETSSPRHPSFRKSDWVPNHFYRPVLSDRNVLKLFLFFFLANQNVLFGFCCISLCGKLIYLSKRMLKKDLTTILLVKILDISFNHQHVVSIILNKWSYKKLSHGQQQKLIIKKERKALFLKLHFSTLRTQGRIYIQLTPFFANKIVKVK